MRRPDPTGNARDRRQSHGSRSVVQRSEGEPVNNLIYIVGLIVVIIAVLSFFGLR